MGLGIRMCTYVRIYRANRVCLCLCVCSVSCVSHVMYSCVSHVMRTSVAQGAKARTCVRTNVVRVSREDTAKGTEERMPVLFVTHGKLHEAKSVVHFLLCCSGKKHPRLKEWPAEPKSTGSRRTLVQDKKKKEKKVYNYAQRKDDCRRLHKVSHFP